MGYFHASRGPGLHLLLGVVATLAVFAFSCSVVSAFSDGDHRQYSELVIVSEAVDSLPYRSFARGLKQADAPTDNNSLLLAEGRTARHDPLNGFRKYRDGWDIRNKHYWASVGFTGIPGFILALLWAAAGLLSLLLLCFYLCCCRHRERGGYHSEKSNLLPLLLLFFLSCAAIAGCVLVYYAQAKFHDELSGTLKYVVSQSHTTVENLQNVSRTLEEGATINIFNFGLPNDEKQKVQQISQQLNSTSNQLETKTQDNAHRIRRGINILRLVMIVVASVMLLLVLLGLLFTACGLPSIVYLLVLLGWILVIGTWILCGLFILLNNVMGDTCVAMEEWVRNPDASTNLDDILPCVNQTTANQTLLRSKEVTVAVVSVLNRAVNVVLNNDNVPAGTAFNFNQSGPLMPTLCNPYGPAPEYNDQACTTRGAISLRDASGNWSAYVCRASNGKCISTGRMTPDVHTQLNKAVIVANGLYVNVPFLVNVENCVFVRDTFQTIISDRCPNLRKYTKWIWIGLILISSGAMLSTILWIIASRRHHRRGYTVPMKEEKPMHPHPT